MQLAALIALAIPAAFFVLGIRILTEYERGVVFRFGRFTGVKLAGFRYLERVRDDTPVLLFDEIFGELDPGRGQRLLGLVGDFAQALITTVQPATAEQIGADAEAFRIEQGTVSGPARPAAG